EITGNLEHPGIVPVYGLGCSPEGRPYYAMRLIQGESLEDAIHRFFEAEHKGRDPGERRLALRALLARFLDVCNALEYAHSRGVLHRELKPSNVMLGKHGETLVVDWGLAKPCPIEGTPQSGEYPIVTMLVGSSKETVPGSTIGTPAFMSPEQAGGRTEE